MKELLQAVYLVKLVESRDERIGSEHELNRLSPYQKFPSSELLDAREDKGDTYTPSPSIARYSKKPSGCTNNVTAHPEQSFILIFSPWTSTLSHCVRPW